MIRPPFPFVALVGQDDMKLALALTVIAPEVSGVLIRGEKGTAKSTAVRALADLLPPRSDIPGDPFHLSLQEYAVYGEALGLDLGAEPDVAPTRITVTELPVGATEDRVVGTLDLEAALIRGQRRFEPGLLASAHRGILYVDEVNLLDDHVVDLLLDSAAMGVNTVEREGVSVVHPARFSLVGTMNPEEGELRPQLLDRFGMCVTVSGASDPAERVAVVERSLAYDADPIAFVDRWAAKSREYAAQLACARERVGRVRIDRAVLVSVAQRCLDAGVDGHRADLMTVRAARALAAWHGREDVTEQDMSTALRFVLPHRMRRRPLEDIGRLTTTH